MNELSELDKYINGGKFNGIVSVYINNLKSYENKTTKYLVGEAINFDDKFLIGSITKQMLSVLVLKLVEENKLSINQPISEYLEEYNHLYWTKLVTITNLLSHTSGICPINSKKISIKELKIENIGAFKYANENYKIVAKIITKKTGEKLQSLYKKLFTELDLPYSLIFNNESIDDINKKYNLNIKSGHICVPYIHSWLLFVFANYKINEGYHKINNPMLDGPQYLHAEGGNVITNVKDLHRWNYLLHNGYIFKNKDTYDLLLKKKSTFTTKKFNNHYGFGISKTCDYPLKYSHSGWVYGFQSFQVS
jgi:D-alanyl-D-alanine carboxypeptidase